MPTQRNGCTAENTSIRFNLAIVALIVSLCWQSAASADIIKTQMLTARSYDSHLAAAIDLAEQFLTSSILEDREHVGAILRDAAGRYWATHGKGGVSQDTVTFSIPKPSDSEIVAFWHTHGRAGFARTLFSPDDVKIVRSTRLPLYLLAPNGDIKILREDLLTGPARLGANRRSALTTPKQARHGLVVARRNDLL